MTEFDSIVAEFTGAFNGAIGTIGGAVAAQGASFVSALAAQRAFLVAASKSKKPDDATFGQMLGATGAQLGAVGNARDAVPRSDKQFNHLSAVAEFAPALGWVQTNLPAPHVKQMFEAGDFYLTKILKDFKSAPDGAVHVAFVNSIKSFATALQAYVKKFHTTGVAWNPHGVAASAAAAAPPAGGGGPPPPGPPPPPAGGVPSKNRAPAAAGAPTAALFADLSKGENVTAGLKKVTRDMTNKDKKVNSVVAAKEPAAGASAAGSGKKKGPEKLALEGNKWCVENFNARDDLRVEGAQRNHVVYIYGLTRCVVNIPDKVNSIAVDSCDRLALVFSSAVSQVEIVNSKNIQIQVLDRVPTIAVDKTSGAQLYLSNASLADPAVQIVTAKSDEVNVFIPGAAEGEDGSEHPIPEQFLTTIVNRRPVTGVVEHKG